MQKRRFITADDGAVTIDWVALAAGLLILGVAIVGLLTGELQTVTDEIETQLTSAATYDPDFENTITGEIPDGAVATGARDTYAQPGDYYRDINGSGAPDAGDHFVLDSDGDGTLETGVADDGNGNASTYGLLMEANPANGMNDDTYVKSPAGAIDGWQKI